MRFTEEQDIYPWRTSFSDFVSKLIYVLIVSLGLVVAVYSTKLNIVIGLVSFSIFLTAGFWAINTIDEKMMRKYYSRK